MARAMRTGAHGRCRHGGRGAGAGQDAAARRVVGARDRHAGLDAAFRGRPAARRPVERRRAAAAGGCARPCPVRRQASEQERRGRVRELPRGRPAVPGRQAGRPGRRHRGASHDAGRWAPRNRRGCSGTAARTACGRRRSGRSKMPSSTAATACATCTLLPAQLRTRVPGGVRADARPGRRCPTMPGPLGTRGRAGGVERDDRSRRDAVNRVFANMGKAIAAFERRSRTASRASTATRRRRGRATAADRSAVGAGSPGPAGVHRQGRSARPATTGRCSPTSSSTTPACRRRDRASPDRGRADGVKKVRSDEFNCLGRYSDAKPEQCGELRFLASDDPGQLGARSRRPSLRNVAQRAPYMHAGQFATLEQVVRHYAASPKAVLGHSELAQPGREARRAAGDPAVDGRRRRTWWRFSAGLSGPVLQAP